MKTLEEKHKDFLNDLVAVCKKHNLSIAHEDNQGAFLIDEYKQKNIEWLMNAMINLTTEEALEEFSCDDCWEKARSNEKNITSLKLILENCESISFPAKCIKSIRVDDIRTNFDYSDGYYSEYIKANQINITIDTQANLIVAYSDGFPLPERKLPFDRIMRHNDITHIKIAYNDNTTEDISVNWQDDDEGNYDNNINQFTTTNSCGDLWISISPKNQDSED
ncbi:MAG: hypothetical protein H6Q69_950 [Firmicutes bacterium]|nr:hypothetical protein [Bacillota bacterium]